MRSRVKWDETDLLLPESISVRELPANLLDAERPLFQKELQRTIPPTRLLSLSDVGISSNGFLFKGLQLLPESFAFPEQLDEWQSRSVVKFFLQNHLIKNRRHFKQPGLWITDHWSNGYFHWLADALPRLYVMRERLDDLVVLLPNQYKDLGFVRPSLEAFGVKNFEFINEEEVLLCDRLFLPTPTAPSGHFIEEIVRGVRKLLVDRYGEQTNSVGERIYLSRSRARKRKIVNEKELHELLVNFDFNVIHAEDFSFTEQVAIAAHANVMISNHGAGLTNMLFMESGSKVFELRHQSDDVNNCYFTMAAALGLSYFYQTCKGETQGENPHTANLVVDLGRLEQNLEQMISEG